MIGLQQADKDTMHEFRTGRQVVYDLHVHLVFTTKYRRGAITDEVREHLKGFMARVCADFDCDLMAFDGEDDHVHLLVRYPPKVSLSRLVNSLKGVSAYRLRQLNRPAVRSKLWGDHFWSPSYCAVSCGGAPLGIIKRYIDDQRNEPRKKGEKRVRAP
jgi:putative transposase